MVGGLKREIFLPDVTIPVTNLARQWRAGLLFSLRNFSLSDDILLFSARSLTCTSSLEH